MVRQTEVVVAAKRDHAPAIDHGFGTARRVQGAAPAPQTLGRQSGEASLQLLPNHGSVASSVATARSASRTASLVVENVGRHEINRGAERSQQHLVAQSVAVEPQAEIGVIGVDIDRPDHPAVAEIPHQRMLGQGRQQRGEALGETPVARQHVVLGKDIQGGQRGAARQRIAGVGMGVEKTARQGVVVEGGVHLVGGHHHRQRQITAGEPLGQTEKVGPDAGLFVGEKGAGATEADHDFIADQMDRVAVAQLAGQPQIVRIVHHHPAGALHQRLDDEGGDGFVVLGQMRFQRRRRATVRHRSPFPPFRRAGVRRRDGGQPAAAEGRRRPCTARHRRPPRCPRFRRDSCRPHREIDFFRAGHRCANK
jgi:hypothetical protein